MTGDGHRPASRSAAARVGLHAKQQVGLRRVVPGEGCARRARRDEHGLLLRTGPAGSERDRELLEQGRKVAALRQSVDEGHPGMCRMQVPAGLLARSHGAARERFDADTRDERAAAHAGGELAHREIDLVVRLRRQDARARAPAVAPGVGCGFDGSGVGAGRHRRTSSVARGRIRHGRIGPGAGARRVIGAGDGNEPGTKEKREEEVRRFAHCSHATRPYRPW
jgi:hypothetical protein